MKFEDDSPGSRRQFARLLELEGLLCVTQAFTPAGLVAQLEFADDEFCRPYIAGSIGGDYDRHIFRNLISSLRSLARAGASSPAA